MRRLYATVPRLAATAVAASAGAIATRAPDARTADAGRPLRRQPLAPDDATASLLERIFHGLGDGDEIPIGDSHLIDDSGGHEAYGEITIRGMRELEPRLGPREGDVFYDLGSGTGKAVIQAALEWPVERAVGVELSPSRNGIGEVAMSRAEPLLQQRVQLRQGDIIACEGCEDASLVYVASLLFDEPFMQRLGARLSSLPKLRTLATLKRFPEGALMGFSEAAENAAPDDDEEVRRERVEVTWGAARVYVYEREVR